MWDVMRRDRDDVLLESNQAGVDKVRADDGGYAFFMESTSIEYQVERNCKLQKIGEDLDAKSYGIALPQGREHCRDGQKMQNKALFWGHIC